MPDAQPFDQLSIPDDLPTEHLSGSLPADEAEAEDAKQQWYASFYTTDATCLPDQGIHIYPPGSRAAMCSCGDPATPKGKR